MRGDKAGLQGGLGALEEEVPGGSILSQVRRASKVDGVKALRVDALQGPKDDRCLPAWGEGAWGGLASLGLLPKAAGKMKLAPSPTAR